jgi:hypothetical protein
LKLINCSVDDAEDDGSWSVARTMRADMRELLSDEIIKPHHLLSSFIIIIIIMIFHHHHHYHIIIIIIIIIIIYLTHNSVDLQPLRP